jgi:DNA-binding transcriptional LysR family regulator
MYLEQVRSFCGVVEHGSFTRAARELHLTQPAVSQHVRSLELAFRIPLLDRVGGRAVPTEAGEILFQHGAEILARMDAIRSGIDALKGLSGGRVAVGASNTAGSYVLPKIVARFHRQCPNLQVVLHVERACAIYEQVLRGTVDFGITVACGQPLGILVEPLYRDQMVLVMSPEHPAGRGLAGPLSPGDLARLPLLALDRASLTRQICDDWFASLGICPSIDMEFDSIAAMKRVIAEGLGAGLLYSSSVSAEVAAGLLKIIDVDAPPLYAQFVLVRRPAQRVSPAARELLGALVRELSEHPHLTDVNTEAARRFVGHPLRSHEVKRPTLLERRDARISQTHVNTTDRDAPMGSGRAIVGARQHRADRR